MTKLTLPANRDELRSRLAPLFHDKGLQLALLFGSAATGRVHHESDIDLAFLYDKPVDLVTLTNNVIKLLETDKIDVVDLLHASPLLKFSAAKQGKILYEKRPCVFHQFYSLAFRMYADTKKLRDAREQSIRHFLKARGVR